MTEIIKGRSHYAGIGVSCV